MKKDLIIEEDLQIGTMDWKISMVSTGATEDKMIKVFIKRYKNTGDIVTEKRIAMKFIKIHGLSIFRFINRLRSADEEICDEFVKALEDD